MAVIQTSSQLQLRALRSGTSVTLVIPRNVYIEMCSQVQQWFPLETGGILLGTRSRDSAQVEVLVGAGPGARRERSGMVPDAAWQAAEVARLYDEANPTLAYLVDCHSPPRST